jgi:hypothetical protein
MTCPVCSRQFDEKVSSASWTSKRGKPAMTICVSCMLRGSIDRIDAVYREWLKAEGK